MGYIANEPESARRLNYLQFHRRHLAEWPQLRAAQETLEAFLKSGLWEGEALEQLLEELTIALDESRSK